MAGQLWQSVLLYDQTKASYWDTQSLVTGTTKVAASASDIHGSIFTVRFNRTVATGYSEDQAMFSYHLATQPIGIAPTGHLSASDAAAVEGKFNSDVWTPMRLKTSASWTLESYVWRDFGADFPLGKTGFSKPGPIWRTTLVGQAGSDVNTSRLPDQVAQTVTFRTASRKHWGRIYYGGYTSTGLAASYGHISTAYVDALANCHGTFFQSLAALPLIVNVWVWSSKQLGMFSVRQMTSDDTFDVIRRRRASQSTYRKTWP